MERAIEKICDIREIQKVKDRYQKSAVNYEKYIKLYNYFWQIFGFRYEQWRRKTIDALNPKEGHTVVDLGCGTGLNFLHLEKRVGSSGHIIGVDISNEMLAMSTKKIKKNNWRNISLINSDFNDYETPDKVDSIISTYSIGLGTNYKNTIEKSFQNLKPGGKFAILCFNDQNLSINAKIFLPFWLSCIQDYSKSTFAFNFKTPWDHIKEIFPKNSLQDFYGGLVYLALGIKSK